MFVTQNSVREQIRQIINDEINNDLIFIIANKGFGKYRLLKEINEFEYQRNVIVTNGDRFHSDSIIKNCLIQGIYEFLRRHNEINRRRQLSDLITKSGKKIPPWHRISFSFHVKLSPGDIECLVQDFSIKALSDIYKEFTDNTPLVFFIRGNELKENDVSFICSLPVENNTKKFTYVIALRPNTEGVEFIRRILENRDGKDGRVWIFPLLPKIRKSNGFSTHLNFPAISLNEVTDWDNYVDFRNEIIRKDYYNQVFESVDALLHYGITPSIIFSVANQEISDAEFKYINLLASNLLDENQISRNAIEKSSDALLFHSGKIMWIDTLACYIFANENVDDIILEIQKFYFALIVDMSNYLLSKNKLYMRSRILFQKKERNNTNNLLKNISKLSINPIVPGLATYMTRISMWVRRFIKAEMKQDFSFDNTNRWLTQLQSFNLIFSNIVAEALESIYIETGYIDVLDIGLQAINQRANMSNHLSSEEVVSMNHFIEVCFNEAFRWNDLTLINEICDVLALLKKNRISVKYSVKQISGNSSIYRYLTHQLKRISIDTGDIIMGRKTVFVSYTSDDKAVVDIIDQYLTSCGLEVKRDIRDIKKYSSIEEFMNTIRKEDYVVPVISDTYLHRSNCMYEIQQLVKDPDFREKTIPVVIDFSKTSERSYNFFDIEYRIEIIEFWESKAKDLDKKISTLSSENRSELDKEYRLIKNFAQSIAEFLAWVKQNMVGVVSPSLSVKKQNETAKSIAIDIEEKIRNIG